MPVINLPKDTRWGDIGQGAGTLIGGVLSGLAEKQMQEGVAAIQADDNIAMAKKPSEIFKRFGYKGLEALTTMNKQREQEAHITQMLATSKLTDVQTALENEKLPFEARLAKAKAGQVEQTTATSNAEEARIRALTQPEVVASGALTAQRTASTALTQAEVPKAQAETEKIKQDTEQKKLLVERARGAQSGQTELSDTLLDTWGIKDEKQRAALKEQYRGAANDHYRAILGGQAGKDPLSVITPAVERMQKAAEPKDLSESEQKYARETVAHAVSAQRFIDNFRRGGSAELGFFKGANAKAFLEKWGIPTGDPLIVDMWNASAQQVQSTATSGGGFFAQGRVKLARDVTAGIAESPLHALLATDQVADRMIAQLEGTKGSITKQNTTALDNALAKWQDVKKVTGSFRSEVIPDPARLDDLARGRTVAFFDNAQIDPKTFGKLVENSDKSYKLPNGRTISGKQLFEAANVLSAQGAMTDPWTAYKLAQERARAQR